MISWKCIVLIMHVKKNLVIHFHTQAFNISNIATLDVLNLHNLEHLMSASVASSCMHFKNLHIFSCESMKEIVVTKEFQQKKSKK